MRDLSLKFPYVIYLMIGALLIGVIIAPSFRTAPLQISAADMRAHEMMHGQIEVDLAQAPTVDLAVEKDPMDGWNIRILTQDFTFTPEAVNGANTANAGHAHLYLDGAKIARVYGAHYHIPDLPAGDYELSVSLSSNDHSYYTVNGAKIEARATLRQP